jgi:hypothetical protein
MFVRGLTVFAIGFMFTAGMIEVAVRVTAETSVTPELVGQRGQAMADRFEKAVGNVNQDYVAGKYKDNEIKAIVGYAKEASGLMDAALAEYGFCEEDKVQAKCEQSMRHLSEVDPLVDALESFHKSAGTQQVQSAPLEEKQ